MLCQFIEHAETDMRKEKIHHNADKKQDIANNFQVIKLQLLWNIHGPLWIDIQGFHGLMMHSKPKKAEEKTYSGSYYFWRIGASKHAFYNTRSQEVIENINTQK